LDILLEAYEQIGQSLILLEQYTTELEQNPPMIRIVGLIYSDLLEFHEQALRIYSGKGFWVLTEDCYIY
jgi:hypothetical protein